MYLSLTIATLIFALSVWAFFHFSPRHHKRLALLSYNLLVCLLALLVCVSYSARIYSEVGGIEKSGMWLLLSSLGCMFIFPTMLLLTGMLRNFVLFWPSKRVTA